MCRFCLLTLGSPRGMSPDSITSFFLQLPCTYINMSLKPLYLELEVIYIACEDFLEGFDDYWNYYWDHCFSKLSFRWLG